MITLFRSRNGPVNFELETMHEPGHVPGTLVVFTWTHLLTLIPLTLNMTTHVAQLGFIIYYYLLLLYYPLPPLCFQLCQVVLFVFLLGVLTLFIVFVHSQLRKKKNKIMLGRAQNK